MQQMQAEQAFVERLKILLPELDLNNRQLTSRARISETKFSKVLHGRAELTAPERDRLVAAIARELGPEIVEIFGEA